MNDRQHTTITFNSLDLLKKHLEKLEKEVSILKDVIARWGKDDGKQ